MYDPAFPNINEEDQDEICKWIQRGDETEVLYRVNELIEETLTVGEERTADSTLSNSSEIPKRCDCHCGEPEYQKEQCEEGVCPFSHCEYCDSKIGNPENSQEKGENKCNCHCHHNGNCVEDAACIAMYCEHCKTPQPESEGVEGWKEKIDFILGDCDMPAYPDAAKDAGVSFTDYLTGAHKHIFSADPKTGKNYIYTPDRNRQCSIGYHLECSDKNGENCGCVCHRIFATIDSLLQAQAKQIRREERDEHKDCNCSHNI